MGDDNRYHMTGLETHKTRKLNESSFQNRLSRVQYFVSVMSQKRLRQWSQENMNMAYSAVIEGRMSIRKAASEFQVPRMSLSDRVNHKVQLQSKSGVCTVLSESDEVALKNYIKYMAQRGFPLSISQVKGFALCIANKSNGNNKFAAQGPSKAWWRNFRRRHPDLGLRRPDALDRGRSSLGNIEVIRSYFELLEKTLKENDLMDKSHRIYNCDEAALYLNKSAGQKVVVPVRTKHAHSLSIATNEHISVHCCANAAGTAIPPMIIYSKTLPGGAYHKDGPVNAIYSCSESGFMNQELYLQWFKKQFLKHVTKERPVILLQDGASSHMCTELIDEAIKNDIILFCLPPKTTHITQPLDVAVYRKMKIETTKLMSQVKLVKSDHWVSKKNVSGLFKIIYEKSFTMSCISEGFRKCGIFPFNPNAIDKELLLRSNVDTVDPNHIDLASSATSDNSDDNTLISPSCPDILSITPIGNSSQTEDHQILNVSQPNLSASMSDLLAIDVSLNANWDDIMFIDENDTQSNERTANDTSVSSCPPELALAAVECSLTPKKRSKYQQCLELGINNIDNDKTYATWKQLKDGVKTNEDMLKEEVPKPISEESNSDNKVMEHPLIKAGLIPSDLVDILVVPSQSESKVPKRRGKKKGAQVLTSEEVVRELKQKVEEKEEKEQEKLRRKIERENKKKQKLEEAVKKQEERKRKREAKQSKKKATKSQKLDEKLVIGQNES